MLKKRIVSGLLMLLAVVLIANYLPPFGAWIVIMAVAGLAQFEFYGMMNGAGIPVFRVLGMSWGAIMISATFWTIGPESADLAKGYQWENLVWVVTLLLVFVRQFPQKNNSRPIETIACTLLGILYVPFLFNYFTRLVFAWEDARMALTVGRTGQMLVLYLVLVVKMSDVGAFFTGKYLGRHKLFPRLSPKKTWEGLIGGIVASLVSSLLFRASVGGCLGAVQLGVIDAVALGLLLPVVGVYGDLFESLLKRAAGMKDSGTLIPGMGGVLDVLDSLLFGAPVLYIYVRMFLTLS